MISLDGTVTLTQMHNIAIFIRKDLHFNVTGLLDQLFYIHGTVAEGFQRLPLCCQKLMFKFFRAEGASHTLTAAAQRCLDHDRITDLCRLFGTRFRVQNSLPCSRNDRHSGSHHSISGGLFIPQTVNDLSGWSDKGDIALLTQGNKAAVL